MHTRRVIDTPSAWKRRRHPALLASVLCTLSALIGARAHAQSARAPSVRAPLVGTVSPSAIGPAAPVATPIGGLITVPRGQSGAGGARGPRWGRSAVGVPLGYMVADAPLPRGAAVVVGRDDEPVAPTQYWIPTADAPRWRIDSTLTRVDAWRDLIVTDVLCSNTGQCTERRQRVQARWRASCGCYAFADAWNRVWRVE